MPFNGSNPRSIAVMDNLRIHHVHEVEHFHQAGILLLFLPAYGPDFNPMEEAFNFINPIYAEKKITRALLKSGIFGRATCEKWTV